MTSTDIESRLRALEDELAIRSLATRFSDCANERDYDGFATLWTEDAIWEIGEPLPARAQGLPAIVEMLRRLLTLQRGFTQMTHSGVVRVDGDRAIARFVEREHGAGETTYYENRAVYNDALRRGADGTWRYTRRSYVGRILDDGPFGGKIFPLSAPKPMTATGY